MSTHPPKQAEQMPPHYRVPAAYLFAPQVDFWEIVCYRADVADGRFQLRGRDMMGLLSHPTFARARREALGGSKPALFVVEEDGERFYVLRAQAESWPDDTLRKPRAYVERGWIVQLGHHRHAKWVLNHLLLARQRRVDKTKDAQRSPPASVSHFSLSWMKLKQDLEAAKNKKVEYRKIKDGFLRLERLGIVTPLTDQATAKVGYGGRFRHRLNTDRLLHVAPKFLHRCQQLEDEPLTLAEAVCHIVHRLADDYRQRGKVVAWPLDWLHGDVEVDLEMQHRRRMAVRRALLWTAVGVLAQGGILRHERSGYALTPGAVERSGDPIALEAWALAALAQVQSEQDDRPSLSQAEETKLNQLLAPCRQRDPSRADLARAIVRQMRYPPEAALPLFALLRRRIDRLPEEQFPALLAHFEGRQARGSFSLHPADILDDLTRHKQDPRPQSLTARKTLKGRRSIVQGQLELPVTVERILQARLYCTLRQGQPVPAELSGQPLSICLCAGDRELYRATLPLLNIPDDPLAPADITQPLRELTGRPPLTLRLTLPARLPALRLLARLEVTATLRNAPEAPIFMSP